MPLAGGDEIPQSTRLQPMLDGMLPQKRGDDRYRCEKLDGGVAFQLIGGSAAGIYADLIQGALILVASRNPNISCKKHSCSLG